MMQDNLKLGAAKLRGNVHVYGIGSAGENMLASMQGFIVRVYNLHQT